MGLVNSIATSARVDSSTVRVVVHAKYWVDNRSGLSLVFKDLDKSVLRLPYASLMSKYRVVSWMCIGAALFLHVGPISCLDKCHVLRLVHYIIYSSSMATVIHQ